MSELILSLIPADDWFWSDSAEAVREARRAGQSNARYYHHRLASFALVRITDDLGNGPETWRSVMGICPAADDETVALDSCTHADELDCLADGPCRGHEIAVKARGAA
jgi:hypothetical protein